MAADVLSPRTSSFRTFGDYPSGPDRQLSEDEVIIANQGRILLSGYVSERLVDDGIFETLETEELLPEHSSYGQTESLKQIGRMFRFAGDEFDEDKQMKKAIDILPKEADPSLLVEIAKTIFDDVANLNWGRIVALFHFTYKAVAKIACDVIETIKEIINVMVDFMKKNIFYWIWKQGGWEAFSATWSSPKRIMTVTGLAAAAIAFMYVYKKYM